MSIREAYHHCAHNMLSAEDKLEYASLSFYGAMDFLNRASYLSSIGIGEWLLEAIDVQRLLLGPTHPYTIDSLAALSVLYELEFRWAEAEALTREVLETRMNELGNEDPATLWCRKILATIMHERSQLLESEHLIIGVIHTEERLGIDQLEIQRSQSILAKILLSQGRSDEAKNLIEQILRKTRNIVGTDHPDMPANIALLVRVYLRQGRLDEARSLCQQNFDAMQRVLGEYHPATISIIADLAQIFESRGQYHEVYEMQTQFVRLRERVLGREHHATLSSKADLARTMWSLDRCHEALEQLKQVVGLYERILILGTDHPSTVESTNS